MKRRLLNVLTALSLLIWVAATALWVRSYLQFDDVVYSGRFRVDNFGSYRGGVVVHFRVIFCAYRRRPSPGRD